MRHQRFDSGSHLKSCVGHDLSVINWLTYGDIDGYIPDDCATKVF